MAMRHLMLALVTVLTLTISVGSTASGQEAGALTIGKSICPPGLRGDQIDPAACTEPAAGVEFFIANPNTDNVEFGTTRGDGLVSFPLDRFAGYPEDSPVDIGEVAASNPYGDLTGYLVNCTKNGEPLAVEYTRDEVAPGGLFFGIRITVIEGDQVACEWFDSHATQGPGTRLPNTGIGTTATGTQLNQLAIVAALLAIGGGIAMLRRRIERRDA
ncbi:MAG: hypothetical protein ACRDJH_14955 [Thermomicrobiales bacterium]